MKLINYKISKFRIINLIGLMIVLLVGCSEDDQFSKWETRTFQKTRVTESSMLEVLIANASDSDEQHVTAIALNQGADPSGHFQIMSVKVGNREVDLNDIVIPPSGKLKVTLGYAPLNMITSVADYGNWETGQAPRWVPGQSENASNKSEAIHRAVLQLSYDYPNDGLLFIQIVGLATPGPNGETDAGGGAGECYPGGGVACYSGGFAIDIPSLYSTGPKDLELTGAIKFQIQGGNVTLDMNNFPPVLMYLRSEEIPQLPSGVTATLIISGSPDELASGTFDGSRLELSDVSFRARVVLGEVIQENVTPGMSAMVDFTISGLEMTTISQLENGKITLHMETTLPDSPSNNPLFDEFLSSAQIIVIMNGQLAL